MKRTSPWTFVLVFNCTTLHFIDASITGVTYMDNFDFEQRYRDVNECNPFYWHPLHLPEKCLKIFEKLIRSNVNSYSPYSEETQGLSEFEYPSNYLSTPEYSSEFVEQTLSPLEIMFKLLRRDIREFPSTPTLGVSPYLGMMAVYKQPISNRSVAMIKKLVRAHM